MIKVMINKQGSHFLIIIDSGRIFYWGQYQTDLWGGPLRWLPQDPSAALRIKSSRNRIPAVVLDMLKVPADELAEFEASKHDDNLLLEFVKRDVIKNNCKIGEIKHEI